MSKINRPPISLARIVRFMKKPGREGRIAVIVGTVTDDTRIWEVPKLTVSFESIQANFCWADFILKELVFSFPISF